MADETWKVGELARATGLTVRTLHYYDEIGLLVPSERSAAGYRLYNTGDIARLQQIRSLRQLGFSLQDIAAWLGDRAYVPQRALRLQVARLREQIAVEEQLCRRLETLAASMDGAEGIPAVDFLQTMETMHMYEKYYTPEQLEELRQRAERIGPERLHEVEAAWPALIEKVKAEMDQGTDPADPRVQALARQWQSLVEEFTGGNPGIAANLQKMYDQEPGVREQAGVDPELFAYIGQAMATLK